MEKRWMLGILVLLLLLGVSFIYPLLAAEPEIVPFQYENGRAVAMPPYPPSADNWLGTDRDGRDLFYSLIKGAKYTILFAMLAALARIAAAVLLGLCLRKKLSAPVAAGFLQAFAFMPQSLLAILWLSPFILYELRTAPPLSFLENLLLQFAIVVTVGIPSLSKMVAETADHIYTLDFMDSARVLGGSPLHIARTHLLPHLLPRLVILGGRQLVQVLTLMLHLAIFNIFIGGTIIHSGQAHDQFNLYYSTTSEWAGLIGSRYRDLMVEPLIVFFPVLAYSLLILIVNLAVKGLEDGSMRRKAV
ncbi:ABC transporter permease subunit [Peribacillus sp. SCS-26]|uniref:ABC transporter permease subunit n=1 Tax=Paraperibacillus marinus TaxID=3115295 RepID=UPI003905D913